MALSDSYLGKYDKVKLLGRGTFGEAWLVMSRISNRSYVMKELTSATWDGREKEQAQSEINILSSCNHVNIIRYNGSYLVKQGLQEEKILIIMEFADADDLAKVVKKQREVLKQHLPEEQILSWFVQITFALQYIHKKNILHRDLKTQNIFLTSQRLVKIGDFGISKRLSHTLDLATTAIGTPHYLSPEICRRQPYSHKSDIWSLGCVLYEMCALSLAFPADNFMALVQSICRGVHRPLPPRYSQKVVDLVGVLLRPSPDRRPSAEQLLTASKLEHEVQTYLALVGGVRAREEGRERAGSATTTTSTSRDGSSTKKPKTPVVKERAEAAGVISGAKEKVVGLAEEARVERERVGSVESGYGSGKVADMEGVVMQTDL